MGNPEMPLNVELDSEDKIQAAEKNVVEGATDYLKEKADDTFDEAKVKARYEEYLRQDVTEPLAEQLSANRPNEENE